MTDLAELVRSYEQARSTNAPLTLSANDLSLLLQFAGMLGGAPTPPTESVVTVPETAATQGLAELLSIEEIADHLRVGLKTLWRIRKSDPTFPKPLRTSARRKQFLRAEFEEWLMSRRD